MHGMNTLVGHGSNTLTHHVTATADTLSGYLGDGRPMPIPTIWFPRLVHATPSLKNPWQFIGTDKTFLGKPLMRILALRRYSQGYVPKRVSRILKK